VYALAHLTLRHEFAAARFVHYCLAATADDTRSSLRRQLFAHIPVFIEFHRGRFPDLEAAFREEISIRLARGQEDFALLFRAAETLRFEPPMAVIEAFLATAGTLLRARAGLEHLAQRDDAAAVAALVRFAEGRRRFMRAAVATLARMTAAEAAPALEGFLAAPDPATRRAAVFGYFSVPHGEEGLPVALAYLNSDADAGAKRALVRELRYRNEAFFAILEQNAEAIEDEALRASVLR
jgi:hypothetical protein